MEAKALTPALLMGVARPVWEQKVAMQQGRDSRMRMVLAGCSPSSIDYPPRAVPYAP